jgi:hypothetical protein
MGWGWSKTGQVGWPGKWQQREVLRPPGLSFSLETTCGGCKWARGGRKPARWGAVVVEKLVVVVGREREVLRPPEPSLSLETRCRGCRQDGGGRKRGGVGWPGG